jgi:hypothetical protein
LHCGWLLAMFVVLVLGLLLAWECLDWLPNQKIFKQLFMEIWLVDTGLLLFVSFASWKPINMSIFKSWSSQPILKKESYTRLRRN